MGKTFDPPTDRQRWDAIREKLGRGHAMTPSTTPGEARTTGEGETKAAHKARTRVEEMASLRTQIMMWRAKAKIVEEEWHKAEAGRTTVLTWQLHILHELEAAGA